MAAYYLVHAGTTLYTVNADTGAVASVSLPAGVTLDSTKRARFAILERQIVGVNAFSRNIVFDPVTATTRLLSISGPGSSVPTLAVGAAGDPTGTYRYKVTFAIISSGVVLTESPFSNTAGPITVASQRIDLSSIPISGTSGVNARRLYRTTNGGTEYFLVTTINDNSTTTYTDNTSDYDLALLPTADNLGNPPGVDGTDRLRLLTAWKDRLWGAPTNTPDRVYFTENRVVYGWAPANFITVKPGGQDLIGVTAFMARRDDLLIGKRRSLWMVRGTSPSDFQVIQIAEGPGPLSQDASLVVRDRAYWLAEDGLYEYGPEGVTNLAREHVYPWFTTTDTFARGEFNNAFAVWDPEYDIINVHLAPVGSTDITRWASYDLRRRTWLGPHKTDAFTPTAAGPIEDSNRMLAPFIGGSNGHLYRRVSTSATDNGTAIDFDVTTKFHSMNTPDVDKYFGELAAISKIQGSGTLTITPSVGGLDASAGTAISHDMTTGRQRLRRLGTGRYVKLRLRNSTDAVPVEVYGFELPYHELGRR